VIGTVCIVVAVAVAFVVLYKGRSVQNRDPAPRRSAYALPTAPGSYIGLYPSGVPASYAGVTAFTAATGIAPNLVTYYSGWLEAFQTSFARSVAAHGAVPLVQVDPTGISLTAIAGGQYDDYLAAYAEAVRAYRHPVVLSFGHEMNGGWYSWGHRHASPTAFVAAWRHIVNLFRVLKVKNVTWLWTINIIHTRHSIPSPGPWWPGASYVNWVGIDGYYYNRSSTFDSLFGPTIAVVRSLTRDPILIAETAVAPSAGQPSKIANLFAAIRADQLLGFVWFDSVHIKNWQLEAPAAIAAFRRGATTYQIPSHSGGLCALCDRNPSEVEGTFTGLLQTGRPFLPG
jgi:mannan endo-1,4-beta-mannosidase